MTIELKIGGIEQDFSEDRHKFIIVRQPNSLIYYAQNAGSGFYHQNIVDRLKIQEADVLGGGVVIPTGFEGSTLSIGQMSKFGSVPTKALERFVPVLLPRYKSLVPEAKEMVVKTNDDEVIHDAWKEILPQL